MTVPTPVHDPERDDRFDRGLELLLHGDPRGINEIEPDLQDISLHMISLANDAGWVEGGVRSPRRTPRFRNAKTILNAIAALVMIGVIGGMIMAGIQVWGPGERDFGSGPNDESTDIGSIEVKPGVCDRLPLTDSEIATIVRSSEPDVYPFQFGGFVGDPRSNSLQVVRDWNACLIDQEWRRAMAYESDYFVWMIGTSQFPQGVGSLTDAEIADRVIDQHSLIPPIPIADELSLYSVENHRIHNDETGFGILGFDAWVVGLDDNGDWIEWPTIVTVHWDGSQLVIVSSTQAGVPESEFQRNDALPSTPEP